MRSIYLVPGFGGSELRRRDNGAVTWVSYTRLAVGAIGELRLGPDGVSPGPPDGVQLDAGPPLADYYGSAMSQLAAAMAPYSYVVVPHGYDWRLSCRVTGPALAARIRAEVTSADPCTIIGHSMGGLVARLAWADLVRTGDTGLCRRIITIGAPHWGSYGIVRLWSLDSDVTSQLSLLSTLSIAIYGILVAEANGTYWSQQRIAALVSTFPSAYELLPSLLGPDAAADPARAAIYTGPWPASRGVSLDRLAEARDVWQPLLAGASTLPPLSVLTTVGGDGYSTVDLLQLPAILGSPFAYRAHDSGDGQVTLASSLLPQSAQYTLAGAHGDLPIITAGLRQAVAAILDERPPTPPPPPSNHVLGAWPQVLFGPPIPSTISSSFDP